MKKITIFNLHLGVGGIEKYVSNLCEMLKNDYIVDLIVTYKLCDDPTFNIDKNINIKYLINDKPNKEEIKEAIKKRKIKDLFFQVFKAISILYKKKIKTIKAIKSLNSDYVITTRTYETKLVNKYLRKSNIIKIATDHNYPTTKYKQKLVKAVSNFDKLIVVNDEIRDLYANDLGDKVIAINNCIDCISNKFHDYNNKNLIAVGRFSKEKGFSDLVDVMNILVKKDSNIKLYLIGDGEEYNNINNKINELNLCNNIVLTGYKNQKEIEKYMLKSNVYLMSSYSESFGLVMLEAMNYGLPVVAFSSACGARVLLKNTGTLINDRNKEEYANKVYEILSNKCKIKELSEKSKNIVKNYSFNRIKEEYLNLLKSFKKSSGKKVLFISSTGGHLNELMQLSSMFDRYDYSIITEKDKSTMCLKDKYKDKIHYLVYGTKDHLFTYIFKFLYNVILSFVYFFKIRPNVIITTGTHTAVPICYIGKIFGSKIIFIETFANRTTKTLSGKLVYPIANLFVVQWEEMKKLYPKAVYGGWIY